MDGLSTKAITDLSSKFDSFKANVDGVDKGFKLYCMNQLRVGLVLLECISVFFQDNNDKIGLCWILQAFGSKNEASDSEKMTRSFLDHTQYTEENIEAYEWIFGEDFISPGGIDENRRFLSYFDKIEAGKKMLDIGCGIGGSPRQVSKELQIDVLGCDISANMLAFAIDRSRVLNDKRVRYLLADAVEYKFEPNSFDYVYSRDCVQHIDELQRLFKNIYVSYIECLFFPIIAFSLFYNKNRFLEQSKAGW
jgi:phosphoethanolamine N-methyltransferase